MVKVILNPVTITWHFLVIYNDIYSITRSKTLSDEPRTVSLLRQQSVN